MAEEEWAPPRSLIFKKMSEALSFECFFVFLNPILKERRSHALREVRGGGGGIRTLETLAGLTVFKTVAIDHSATPPRAADCTRFFAFVSSQDRDV